MKSSDEPGKMAERKTIARPLLERIYTLHGKSAKVIAPRKFAKSFDLLLGSYPQSLSPIEPDVEVRVERLGESPDGFIVTSDAEEFPESWRRENPRASLRVEWMVISQLLGKWNDLVHVHAGLVGNDKRSALLVGQSGSGKSTTTMALALRGFDVYTDDVALIEPQTRRPLSVPRPIKLDDQSRRMLRTRGLQIPPGSRYGESIQRSVLPGLVDPTTGGPPLAAAFFFAQREDGSSPILRPLTRAEAVMRLLLQSASETFEANAISDRTIDLINAVECFELVPGDLDKTVDLIQQYLIQATIPKRG